MNLEQLEPAWTRALQQLAETERLPAPPAGPELDLDLGRALYYTLYKYWLDACDDGRLLCRVQRCLTAVLLPVLLAGLPGALPPRTQLLHCCRELEHNDENLAALDTAMETLPCFRPPALGRMLTELERNRVVKW